jgi:hypothetical protein
VTRRDLERGADYFLRRAREARAAGHLREALNLMNVAVWFAEKAERTP